MQNKLALLKHYFGMALPIAQRIYLARAKSQGYSKEVERIRLLIALIEEQTSHEGHDTAIGKTRGHSDDVAGDTGHT